MPTKQPPTRARRASAPPPEPVRSAEIGGDGEPGPETAPTGTEPENRWASRDDLPSGEQVYVDIVLPIKQVLVRVRLGQTDDVALLTALPDLERFGQLAAKVQRLAAEREKEGDEADPEPTDEERSTFAEFQRERARYLAQTAHIAVVDPDHWGDVTRCSSCEASHPVSLWSAEQTRYLHWDDLEAISAVFERSSEVERHVPFSPETTPTPTRKRAASGESTQQTS